MLPDEEFDLPFLPETNEAVRRTRTVKQQSISQGHPAYAGRSPREAQALWEATQRHSRGEPFNLPADGAAPRPLSQALTARQQLEASTREPYASSPEHTAQLASINRRMEGLDAREQELSGPTDYSELQSYARNRGNTFLPMALSAAMLGRGPRGAEPLAKIAANQAQQALDPIKVEGGYIDSAGNPVIDPAFQKTKQVEALRNRILLLEKLKTESVSADDRARLAHEQKMLMRRMELQQFDAEERQRATMNEFRRADDRRADAAQGEAASRNWRTIKDETGREILYNVATGEKRDPLAAGGGAVPGAPGAPQQYPTTQNPKASEGERNTAFNANIITSAAQRIPPGNASPGFFEAAASTFLPEKMGAATANAVSPAGRQIARAAQGDALDAILYLATGAAYTERQEMAKSGAYLPAYFDADETKLDKVKRLGELAIAARNRAGRAWTQKEEDQLQQALRVLGVPPAGGAGGGGGGNDLAARIAAEAERRAGRR